MIHDKEMEALVEEQTKYFMEDAPIEKRKDVFKRIVNLQEKRQAKK